MSDEAWMVIWYKIVEDFVFLLSITILSPLFWMALIIGLIIRAMGR